MELKHLLMLLVLVCVLVKVMSPKDPTVETQRLMQVINELTLTDV